MKKSRSESLATFSTGWLHMAANSRLRLSRLRRISLASLAMSLACPWVPPLGWWIMMRLWGSAERLPLVPAARRNAPMLAAWPTQMVTTSDFT